MRHKSCRDGQAQKRQEPAITKSMKTACAVGRRRYDSIMCSTSEQRLAEIGRAIDDLAALAEADGARAPDAAHAPGNLMPARGQTGHGAGEVMQAVAEAWAKLAQLDPEVAKRLPTYEA